MSLNAGWPRWHSKNLWRALGEPFASERERWILWVPVLLGAGIAVYFSLPAEPPVWLAPFLLATILAGTWLVRRGSLTPLILIGLAIVTAGFIAAQTRTLVLDTAMLDRRIGPLQITGVVDRAEISGRRRRLVLSQVEPAEWGSTAIPRRVRVSVRGGGDLRPGDRVRLTAVLNPPSPPMEPGAFDFRRHAFFQGLGAIGYGLGAPILVKRGAVTGFGVASARWRMGITQGILEAAPGPAGAVAAALLTGERGAVPDAVMTEVRDSGLAHLLAISGLHMALVAGTLFFAARAFFASMESVALKFPIKKWAAIAAFAGALAYLLISGATVPTQRAFLMTSVVLLAILVDRRAISMRLVAWAALAILVFRPESLLSASFQLSFAAVVALVAVYETLGQRFGGWRRGGGWARRAFLYLAAVGLTTLIAGAATAPFGAYHFNRFVDYGLVANLLAVPLMAFWVMPWGVVTFLLMPFGLEGLGLVPMTLGIDVILWIASTVSAWPGAVRLLPAMPVAGLALLAAGGLWLCLWRKGWRQWGWLAIAAGLGSAALVRPPDVLIDGDAKLVAVRSPDGGLMVSSTKIAKFVSEIWLRRSGEAQSTAWPGADPSGRLRCDSFGCIFRPGGHTVALPFSDAALTEDCLTADVVVSRVPVRRGCPSAHVVIDRFDLWREGAHALWFTGDGVRVESAGAGQGARPWSLHRERKRKKPKPEGGKI